MWNVESPEPEGQQCKPQEHSDRSDAENAFTCEEEELGAAAIEVAGRCHAWGAALPALRTLGEKLLHYDEANSPLTSPAGSTTDGEDVAIGAIQLEIPPPEEDAMPPSLVASEVRGACLGPHVGTWTHAALSTLWRITSHWSDSFDDFERGGL